MSCRPRRARAITDLTPLSESSGLCGGPGQISCSEANELIQIYLDRRTDPDTGERVAEHLGDCPPCESEFVVYQRIIASLSRCRPDLPPDTKQRLEQLLSRPRPATTPDCRSAGYL